MVPARCCQGERGRLASVRGSGRGRGVGRATAGPGKIKEESEDGLAILDDRALLKALEVEKQTTVKT